MPKKKKPSNHSLWSQLMKLGFKLNKKLLVTCHFIQSGLERTQCWPFICPVQKILSMAPLAIKREEVTLVLDDLICCLGKTGRFLYALVCCFFFHQEQEVYAGWSAALYSDFQTDVTVCTVVYYS